MINRGYAFLILALSAALIDPASSQTEEFESLEFGFSAEYPRELDINLLPQDVTSGVEDPVVEFSASGVMTILVGASEKRGLSLERFSSRAESGYQESSENFEVMNVRRRRSKRRQVPGEGVSPWRTSLPPAA